MPGTKSADSEDIVDHMEGAAEEGTRFHVKQSMFCSHYIYYEVTNEFTSFMNTFKKLFLH